MSPCPQVRALLVGEDTRTSRLHTSRPQRQGLADVQEPGRAGQAAAARGRGVWQPMQLTAMPHWRAVDYLRYWFYRWAVTSCMLV